MKIQYLDKDEIIDQFKQRHPEYSERKLTVIIHDTSYTIKCGKTTLETVAPLIGNETIIFKEASKIYGYCRISSAKQSIERQIRNIKDIYPKAIIIQEAYTGTTTDRPAWNRLYASVKDGDTIIFDSVSRMSRNATEGFEIYQQLYDRNVNLIFLKEPHINTDTYRSSLQNQVPTTNSDVDLILNGINAYLMALAKTQIRLAFDQAEKEVLDLRQRTREGIETARLKGKQIGQKRGKKLIVKKEQPAKDIIIKHSKSFRGSLSDEECRKLAGISRNTFYKYKKDLRSKIGLINGYSCQKKL